MSVTVNRNFTLVSSFIVFCLLATLPILLAESGSCAVLTTSQDWRYSMMASGLAAKNDCLLGNKPMECPDKQIYD